MDQKVQNYQLRTGPLEGVEFNNLIIVQEAFNFINRSGTRGEEQIIIKLDMNKAYDRLEWDFLERCLMKYGFCSDWIKLVMNLVRGVSYRYKINGVIGDKLIPE